MDHPCMVFALCGHRFALPASDVAAAVDPVAITPLSVTVTAVIGVLHHEGQLAPVMDLRRALELGQYEDERKTCLLLRTRRAELPLVGVLADRVEGTLRALGTWPVPRLAASRASCVAGLAHVSGKLLVTIETSRLHDLLDVPAVMRSLASLKLDEPGA